MKYNILGDTNIKVSEICFGSLTISPLQANLEINKAGELIKYAYDRGINFIDTAELYDNYKHIKEGIKLIGRKNFVIATKSYSYSEETAKDSLEKALKELDTDYIDIFLLHEQESIHTIRGHYEAIEYFIKAKEKGLIKAIGISTHMVSGVMATLDYDEIEVIHPIINKSGVGIQDGSVEDMLKALNLAYNKKKGIYGMKPLGGGHLIKNAEESLGFVKNIKYLHSLAIGMQCREEIDANVNFFEKGYFPKEIKDIINNRKRSLHIADWCEGCGNCVDTCQHNGIEIINNKAVPIYDNCVFCGYCAKKCKEFCIKVV